MGFVWLIICVVFLCIGLIAIIKGNERGFTIIGWIFTIISAIAIVINIPYIIDYNSLSLSQSAHSNQESQSVASEQTSMESSTDDTRAYQGYAGKWGNIVNGGFADESKDWIYYINRDDESKIYRINKDGTQNTKITDFPVSHLNVDDEWIYFSANQPIMYSGLYKIMTDGTKLTSIYDCGTALDITVNDDWIYFHPLTPNGSNVYKVKTDGTQLSKIIEDDTAFVNVVDKNGIYYQNNSDNRKLYYSKLDGSEKTKLTDDSLWSPIVYNGFIYYASFDGGEGLYRIDINGENRTKILDGRFSSFNISNGWIYYSNGNDENRIYRVRLDGSFNDNLTNHTGYEMCVVNDWIYYRSTTTQFKMRTTGLTE